MRRTPFVQATLALTLRWAWRLRREPAGIAASLAQPALWLVLFGSLFGNLGVTGEGGNYVSFLTAGVVVMTVFNGALSGGVEILFDRENGVLERLLAAPIPAGAILASRTVFVLTLTGTQALIILLTAFVLGVKVEAGVVGAVLILVTGLMLGIGITAVSMSLAFGLRGHGQFFSITGFVSLPFIFASSALAPLESMPSALRLLAGLNPLTYAIESVRSLVLDGWDWSVLLSMSGAITIFDAISVVVCLTVMRRTVE